MRKFISLVLIMALGVLQTTPIALAEYETWSWIAEVSKSTTISESNEQTQVDSLSWSIDTNIVESTWSTETIAPLVESVINNIIEKEKHDIDNEDVKKVLWNLFESSESKDTVSVRENDGNTTMIDTESNLWKIKNKKLANLLSKKAKVWSVITDIWNEFTSGISFSSNGTKITILPLFWYEAEVEKTSEDSTVRYESKDFSTVMKYDADKNALKEAIVLGAESKYVKDWSVRLDWKISFDKRLMFKPTPEWDYKIYELSWNGDYIATLPKMFYIDKSWNSHYDNVKTEIKLDNASDWAFMTLKIDNISQEQFPIVIDPSVESESNNETLTQTWSSQNYDSSNFFIDTIGRDNPNFNAQMLSDLSKLKVSSKIAADKFYTKSSSGSISTKLSTTEDLFKEISVNKTVEYTVNWDNIFEKNHINKSKAINRTVRFDLLNKKFENTDYTNSYGDSKIYFNENDIISYNQGNVDSKAVLKEWIYAMSKNNDAWSSYEWKVSWIGSTFEFENLLDWSLSIKSDIWEDKKYEILRLEPIYYYDNKWNKKWAKYAYDNDKQTINISITEDDSNYPLMIDPTIIGSAYFDLTWSGSGSTFYSPTYMVHKGGRFFIADGNLMDIKVYDDSYNFVWQLWSRSNWLSTTQDKLSWTWASFWLPGSIDVDGSWSIYVVDVNNRKVKKYDSNFNYVWTLWSYAWDNNLSWEQAQLSNAQWWQGIAIDSLWYIYVQSNWRIKKYDSNANYVSTILGTWVQWDNTLNGTSAQWNWLSQIAFDNADNLYLVDWNWYKIKKYTKDWTYISTLGSWVNAAPNNLSWTSAILSPSKVAFNSTNQIYVYSWYGCSIKKYDTSFNWISNLWGSSCAYNQLNGESAQISSSAWLYVNWSWDIYTMDASYKLLRKYNSAYVWQWDVLWSTYTTYNDLSGTSAKVYNISAKSSVDINNNIWIVNWSYVKKYDSNWNFLLRIWDHVNSWYNQLSWTSALLYWFYIVNDGSGNVLISSNAGIKKYSSTGAWIWDLWDPYSNADNNLSWTWARFNNITNLYLDKTDNKLYVTDSSSRKVKVYDSNWNFVSVLWSWVYWDNTLWWASAQFYTPYSFVKLPNGNFLLIGSNWKFYTYDSNFNYISSTYPPALLNWTSWETQLVVDSNSMVVMSQPKYNMVSVFDPTNISIIWFFWSGVAWDSENMFSNPTSVSLDSTWNIFVMDSYNGKVKKILKDIVAPTANTGTVNQSYFTINPIDASTIYKITYCTDTFNTCTPNLTLTWWVWDVNTVSYRWTQYLRYKIMDSWFNESWIYSQTFLSDTTAPVAWLMFKETIGAVLVDNDLSWENAIFRSMQDIAIDTNLNLYVSDYSNYRMKKYSSTWSFLFGIWNWNAWVSNELSLGSAKITPFRSATDNLWNIYIAPIASDYKIKKYDANGNFLFTIGDGTTGDNNLSGTSAKLKSVRYLAVNSLNQLLVLDGTSPSLIKIYDSNGNYLSRISYAVWSWTPNKIALDSSDNIYLYRNRAILKFNSAGTYIWTLWLDDGTASTPPNTLSWTWARLWNTPNFDVDESWNIYVARQATNSYSKLTKYDTNLNYIWDLIWQDTVGDNDLSWTAALLKTMTNVEVWSGRIYLLDNTALNIKYYDLSWNFIWRIGKNYYDNTLSWKPNIWLKSIQSIIKWYNWNWYIADSGVHGVKVYDSNWNFLLRLWNPSGVSWTWSYFNGPMFVKSDSVGNILVVDQQNHAIKKFSSTGALMAVLWTEWTSWNNNLSGTAALLQYPSRVEIDNSWSIYVTSNINVLKKYDSNFNYVWSFNKCVQHVVFNSWYIWTWWDCSAPYTYKLVKSDTDFNEISSFWWNIDWAWATPYSAKQSGKYAANKYIASAWLFLDAYNNVYIQSNLTANWLWMKFDQNWNFLMAWWSYGVQVAVTPMNYNLDGQDAPTYWYPIYVDDLMNVYRTRWGGISVYTQEWVRPNTYTNTGSTYIKTVADDAGGVKSTLLSCDWTNYYEEYYSKSWKNIDVISQSTYASSLASKWSSLWYKSIAADKTGKNIVALINSSWASISNDYWNTWHNTIIWAYTFTNVDISSDWTVISWVTNNNKIYVSTDWWNTFTWSETNRVWTAISMNDSWNIQLAWVNGWYLYISTDTWSTWTQTWTSDWWLGVDMSDDWRYMIASSTNGSYLSTNTWSTWTQISTSTFSKNAKISSDWKVIAFLSWSPTVILNVSTNYGGSFTTMRSTTGSPKFSMSSLWNEITFAENPGLLYKSYDYGATWASIGTSQSWIGLDESSDGDRLYAITDFIYTAYNNSVKCSVWDGTKTIYAKFKDYGDNVSVVYSWTTILDTTAPVLTNVLPTWSGYLNTPEVYYTLSENTASWSITFTRTSWTADSNSPHICQLQGTSLNSWAHNKLTLNIDSNICASFDNPVDWAIYDITFSFTDFAWNVSTSTVKNNITYWNNRFWIWWTWNFSDTNHWSLTSAWTGWATAPTSSLNVIFDNYSSTTNAAYTVTIDAVWNVNDFVMNWPGGWNKVTIAWSQAINIYWSLSLLWWSAWITNSYTWGLIFNATSLWKTISTNGLTLTSAFTFNGVGWGWTLLANLNLNNGNTYNITVNNGSLNTNGKTVDCLTLISSWVGVRSISLWSSTIHPSNWVNFWTTTNLTFDAWTSNFSVTNWSTSFNWGWLTFYDATITASTSISWNNTFRNLTLSPLANQTYSVVLSWIQTITGTFTSNGQSTLNRIYLQSSVRWTPVTIVANAISISNTDFRDITWSWVATWNMPNSTWDCGGNTGMTLSTPTNIYWYTPTTGSKTWSTAWNWFLWSGWTGWAARIPLPQDTAIFNSSSFGAAWTTVVLDAIRVGSINWTWVNNNPTWNVDNSWNIVPKLYGWLILDNWFTEAWSTNTIVFEWRWTHNINFANKVLERWIQVDSLSGTINMTWPVSIWTTRSLTVTTWTFSNGWAGNVITAWWIYAANVVNSTITLGSATHLITWTIWFLIQWAWLWTVNAWTSTIKYTNTSNTAMSFAWFWKTFYNIWFDRGASTGSNTISWNNKFDDFKDTWTSAHSILFTAWTNNTFNTFTVSGTAWNLKTLNSTSTATFTLTKSWSSVVNSDYLNIQHSIGTPASKWYAWLNSVNNQAVASAGNGWIFNIPNYAPTVTALNTPTDNVLVASRQFSATCTDPNVGDTITGHFVIGWTDYAETSTPWVTPHTFTYTHTADLNWVVWYAYCSDWLLSSSNSSSYTAKIDATWPTGSTVSFTWITSTWVTVKETTATDAWFGLHATWSNFRINGTTTSWFVSWTTWYSFTWLSSNTSYAFEVQTKDSAWNLSSWTAPTNKYTLSLTPWTLSWTWYSTTRIDLSFLSWSNNSSTQYEIALSNDNWVTTKYVQSNLSIWDPTYFNTCLWFWLGANCGGSIRITSLTPNSTYKIKVKSRNGDNVESIYWNEVSINTNEYLSFSVNSPSVNFANTTPWLPYIQSTTLNLLTNVENGVQISIKRATTDATVWHSSDADQNTFNTGSDIQDKTEFNGSNSALWSWNWLWFRINKTNTATNFYDSNIWWTDDTTNSKWSWIPFSYVNITTYNSFISASSQIQIDYKMLLPSTQKTGSYQWDITVRAYVNL